MDGFTDLVVGATATDVGDGTVNVPVGRHGVALQQGGGRHDHARLAVAALGHVHLNPGLLDRMGTVRGESFDGCYRLAHDFSHSDATGAYGTSVDMNGAGTALLDAASVLGAVELELIPQCPKQGRVCCHIDFILFPVDFECSQILLLILLF